MPIHPLAIVSPTATLPPGVEIGPFCIIEEGVTLGDGCRLESHVTLAEGTVLGENNHLFQGVVVGGPPQHLQATDQLGGTRIGSGNTLRENTTIHRAMQPGDWTTLGDDNCLMVNAHVAHDCHVGSHVVLANNVMLAGHVTIEDRAFLSGAVGVHQFCRVGRLAMVGGQARVCRDVLPFVLIDGVSTAVVGLNRVGLRRAGYSAEEVTQLKAAYRLIYRSGLPWDELLDQLGRQFPEGPAACYREFCAGAKRGIVSERRLPPGATIKLHQAETTTSAPPRRMAG
ncbi:MAG: acyl-ACP--UDP-N-acetylglucosamine O-acyltransferase [Planctomycetes bacterium]|nr:acyl-ACP--UDP-N-acetylglucosamine O-acyltransferase [Planctomycetota bacterium]